MDCDIHEIAEKYIEEKPQIGEIPVAPDERQSAPVIQGTGVEDTTITEGTVTFDIRFTAAVPSDYKSAGSPDREKNRPDSQCGSPEPVLSRISFGKKRNLLLLSDDFQPVWDGFYGQSL